MSKYKLIICRHLIENMFLRFCPPLLQLLKNFPSHRIATEDKNIIRGFMNIFDCHLGIFNDSWSKGKSEQELKPVLEGIFLYSCVWAMGGLCDRLVIILCVNNQDSQIV